MQCAVECKNVTADKTTWFANELIDHDLPTKYQHLKNTEAIFIG